VLYDPIHNYFGLGYYALGLTGPSYYFINFIALTGFLVISTSAYFLKYGFEKSETENTKLIHQLSFKQKELLYANTVIAEQREMLEKENERLNNDLLQKNEQLSATNSELIAHNNNLEQFSYTISHNLRGPLASLQGLANIVNQDQLGPDNKPLFSHFLRSVNALDTTIRDLSHIIEIRNNVSSVRNTVNLNKEVQHIKELLRKEITDHRVVITCEFRIVEFETVKSMLHSILYNLISNAIKYRSYERTPIINLRSQQVGSSIQLEVQDNGLGIDLEQHKEKIFGLYKRFHTHTDGKGLGLFLVKLQAETLGGNVHIQSKPGIGTTFTIMVGVSD
jgi:signal transduction histidine kinase